MNISVLYHSGSGNTQKIAEQILAGALSIKTIKGNLVNVADLKDIDWDCLHQSQALIFGSPTYMGSVSGVFKVFMDQTSDFWIEQKWANKMAAGFTIGTGASGDKLNTLIQLSIFAAQHGMIWIGQNYLGGIYDEENKKINRAGSWLGMMGQSIKDRGNYISEEDSQTAQLFGKRVAEATIRWNKGK